MIDAAAEWFSTRFLSKPDALADLVEKCNAGDMGARALVIDLADSGNHDAQALIAKGLFNLAYRDEDRSALYQCEMMLRRAAESGLPCHLKALASFLIFMAKVASDENGYDVDTCLLHAILLCEVAADQGDEDAATELNILIAAASPAVIQTIHDMRAAAVATVH